MDVESTFLTEMIIYAYSGVIRWLGVSPCGNLLASLGYQSANLMEELRFWYLEGDGLQPKPWGIELRFPKDEQI